MGQPRARYYATLQEAGLAEYPAKVQESSRRTNARILEFAEDPRLRKFATEYKCQESLDDIQVFFQSLKLPPLKKDIFFGFFPTPTLNAESRGLGEDGYLVLIHGGLSGLITSAVALVVYSSPSQTAEGRMVPPLVSPQDAAQILNQVVAASGRFEPFISPIDLHPRHYSELLWIMFVFGGAQTFVMAHEYAHAHLGHLESAPTVRLPTPRGDVRVNKRQVDREWMADRKATDIILNKVRSIRQRSDPEGTADLMSPLLAGPMSVLMLLSWLPAGTTPDVIDHPPPTERLLALESAFRKEFGEMIEYRRAWNFVSQLEALGFAGGLVKEPLFRLPEHHDEETYIALTERGLELKQRSEDRSLN